MGRSAVGSETRLGSSRRGTRSGTGACARAISESAVRVAASRAGRIAPINVAARTTWGGTCATAILFTLGRLTNVDMVLTPFSDMQFAFVAVKVVFRLFRDCGGRFPAG